MEVNLCYDVGRSLTYIQFPGMFTYDSSKRKWKPRQQGQSVGRLNFVHSSFRELYYMRLLLNVQVGFKIFELLRVMFFILTMRHVLPWDCWLIIDNSLMLSTR